MSADLKADFAERVGAALVIGGSGGLGRATVRRRGGRGSTACAELVEQVVTRYGGLHTLVYAAGPHVPMRHLSKVDPADLVTQLDADTGAFFRIVSAALPALRAAEGSVVAVTTAATTRFPIR